MASHNFTPGEQARGQAPARVEYLRVENYRALRKVELRDIRPLTVLLGPNGSGKSTLFDCATRGTDGARPRNSRLAGKMAL